MRHMEPASRAAAQRRANDIRIFRQELNRLEADGVVVLSGEQRQAASAHHDALLAEYAREFDIDRDVRSSRLSWGMRIASFCGALALAASVFFLFRQFWGLFSEYAQVVLLVTASLTSFAVTWWIRGRDGSGYFTKLAAMVAFACFVLNVVMLGQIFNITPSDKALLPWAAYALLLAYACDLRLLLAAALLCVIAYVAARVGTWSGVYWIHFGERPENFFPVAIVMFFWPQFFTHNRHDDFPAVFRLCGLLSLLLPVLVLSHWGAASYLEWTPSAIESGYQLLGFFLSAVFVWLGLRRNWGDTVNTGVVFFVIFLYTKFYDWWWDVMPKYLFFLVLGLTALLVLMIMKRLRQSETGEEGASS